MRGTMSRLPRWALPVGALTAGAVLVWQGRFVVSGLLAAAAISFALCLVLLMLWAFVGMALPGRHVTLDGPRAVAGQLHAEFVDRAGRVRRLLGRAPWRGNQQVLATTATQVRSEVVELPSGRAAVRTVEVRLHPDTIDDLDSWMPIEDAARHWARAYASAHATLPSDAGKVSVLVIADDQVPVNRSRVTSTLRGPAHPRAVALASAPLPGPRVDPARGMHTILRVDPIAPSPDPVRPAGPPRDGGTRLEPDRTVRIPAGQAGVAKPSPGQADRLASLALIPVDPGTGKRTGHPTSSLRGPRVRVGRGADQDLRLPDSHVSRRHAEISRLGTGWVITDRHSTHGTHLNGAALDPGIPHPLTDGDLLEIGKPGRDGTPTAYEVADRDGQRGHPRVGHPTRAAG